MKRRICCTFFLLFSFILGGCAQTELTEPSKEHNIIIRYDMAKVTKREEATIYKAEAYQANERLMYEKLLNNDGIVETNAFGKTIYQYEGREVSKSLTLYEVGAKAGIYGGFNFDIYNLKRGAYQDIIYIYDEHLDSSAQIGGGIDRKDYGNNVNLSFRSIEESLKEMDKLFIEIEMPKLQVKNVYAMNKDTMNEHARKNETAANWSEADEAYFIEYMQVVDGLPLINHMWTNMTRSEATETIISAINSEKGIESLVVQGAVEACVKLDTQKIISPKEAEEIMINLYKSNSFVNNVVAEELDLYYIVLKQEEELRLVPAYIFCMAIEDIYTDLETGKDITISQYQHCVVNAVNGEVVTGSGF